MHIRNPRYFQFYSEDIPLLILRYLDAFEWQSLLDIGCGYGAFLFALSKLGYLQKKSVYAIDLHKDKIDQAQNIDKDFSCHVDDAKHLKTIEENQIDFVISSQVIEHIDDDQQMIKTISRVLKRDGCCYLSTVFKTKYAWYFYRNNGRWMLDPTHIREYTHEEQLLGKIRNCGFKVLENRKTLIQYPILELLLRKLNPDRDIFHSKLLRVLRKVRLPVIGYFCWELIIKNESS
jgi:2-polyprenyl-3-methyl-5-hydroxy-6-metoxy-1,4-benzoquinol methylase